MNVLREMINSDRTHLVSALFLSLLAQENISFSFRIWDLSTEGKYNWMSRSIFQKGTKKTQIRAFFILALYSLLLLLRWSIAMM